MSKVFESVGIKKPRYSAFDLSHEKKLSLNMGELVPILMEEIVPGDKFKISSEIMLRLAPMIAPVMHRVNVYVHYFFVPNRIIWDEWEDFITGGPAGLTTPTMPTAAFTNLWPGGVGAGKLADYLGIPVMNSAVTYNPQISLLPFRGYTKIFNEYYRDETLQTEEDITVTANVIELRKRCWEKDYFTSALPFTQRGPTVGVPISFDPQVNEPDQVWNVQQNPPVLDATTGDLDSQSGNLNRAGTGSGLRSLDNTSSLDITIEDLRQSSRLQEWLERQARGGYRYIETILSHFGVKSSDARLQRPEYLGGGRQPVVMSEVLNTSATATDPQGTMAGHGISVGTANRAARRFEEHGYLFGILSVLPRTNYQEGIPRTFLREDKLDYYWPEFAHLGEQPVELRELWYRGNELQANQEGAFGYQQRYAEYKYCQSTVHGDFKTTLNFWHLGRIFGATEPGLNEQFVEASPSDRIFAVQGADDHLWCQVFNNVKARRPMPYFSNPKL